MCGGDLGGFNGANGLDGGWGVYWLFSLSFSVFLIASVSVVYVWYRSHRLEYHSETVSSKETFSSFHDIWAIIVPSSLSSQIDDIVPSVISPFDISTTI